MSNRHMQSIIVMLKILDPMVTLVKQLICTWHLGDDIWPVESIIKVIRNRAERQKRSGKEPPWSFISGGSKVLRLTLENVCVKSLQFSL